MSPQDERLWATLAHIGGLVVPFASLIVFLIYKDRSQFVRLHSGEALNFHLSMLIYEFTGLLSAFVVALATAGIGLLLIFPVLIGVGVLALVTMIQGAIAANQGRPYRYPLTIRLVH
jgi:hypothetical protein